MFFFMLLTLGIGTNVAQMACFMTIIRDQFPKVKHWHAALLIAIVFICLGSIYLTPVSLLLVPKLQFQTTNCNFRAVNT